MNVKVRQIEVDAETADLLEARAAARGMSVAELVADLASNYEALPPDLADSRGKARFSQRAVAVLADAIQSLHSLPDRARPSRIAGALS
jgi:hypothetical protein